MKLYQVVVKDVIRRKRRMSYAILGVVIGRGKAGEFIINSRKALFGEKHELNLQGKEVVVKWD